MFALRGNRTRDLLRSRHRLRSKYLLYSSCERTCGEVSRASSVEVEVEGAGLAARRRLCPNALPGASAAACYTYLHTYIALTLYPLQGSRGISDIAPRGPRFTKIT
jgi:hypothetical protein